MFTKALILILSGTNLVLANPFKEEVKQLKDSIAEDTKALTDKSFEKLLNKTNRKYAEYTGAGENELSKLSAEYYQLKEENEAALAKKQQEFTKELNELKKTAPEKYEKRKKEVSKILDTEEAKYKYSLKKLKEEKIMPVINKVNKLFKGNPGEE